MRRNGNLLVVARAIHTAGCERCRQNIGRLDKPTRLRFKKKFSDLLTDPFDPAHSEALTSAEKRKARIGGYRALILIDAVNRVVIISDVGPRGQIYRGV